MCDGLGGGTNTPQNAQIPPPKDRGAACRSALTQVNAQVERAQTNAQTERAQITANGATRPFTFDRLILASASPRRSFLLGELGLSGFGIEVAGVEEHEDPHSCPQQMVRHNARIKAEAISHKHPRSLVLGADTTVALEGEALNKPADLAEARTMLHKLSGRTHTVYTGVCLISPADALHEVHHVASAVTFRTLDDDAIDAYFRLVNPLDKAGAYGIQEGRELIIDHLQGSLENVMGLPIQFLCERWHALGCLQRLRQLHDVNHPRPAPDTGV